MERELFDKELIKSNLNKRKAKDKVLKIIDSANDWADSLKFKK